jgi:hypothetical protein
MPALQKDRPDRQPSARFCVYEVMPFLQDIRYGFRTLTRSYIEYRDRNSTLAGLAAFQMRALLNPRSARS